MQEYKIGTFVNTTTEVTSVTKTSYTIPANQNICFVTESVIFDPSKITIIQTDEKQLTLFINPEIITDKMVAIFVPKNLLLSLCTRNHSHMYKLIGTDTYIYLYYIDGDYKLIDNSIFLDLSLKKIEFSDLKGVTNLYNSKDTVLLRYVDKLKIFKLLGNKQLNFVKEFTIKNDLQIIKNEENFFLKEGDIIQDLNDEVVLNDCIQINENISFCKYENILNFGKNKINVNIQNKYIQKIESYLNIFKDLKDIIYLNFSDFGIFAIYKQDNINYFIEIFEDELQKAIQMKDENILKIGIIKEYFLYVITEKYLTIYLFTGYDLKFVHIINTDQIYSIDRNLMYIQDNELYYLEL